MRSLQDSDPAFVGAKGIPLLLPNKARICSADIPRSRSVRQWRCVLQDGQPGQGDNVTQPEGALPPEKLDAGLEEALSKSWDALENFNLNLAIPENEQSDMREEESEKATDASNAAPEDSKSSQNEQPAGEESSDGSTGEIHATASKTAAKTKTKRKRKTTKKPAKETSKMTEFELKDSVEWSKESRWYFVQVKPGCEQSTAVSIRNLSNNIETSQVREVLVPTTTIMRLTKGGKSVKKEERFFPSYILVLMIMNRRTYSSILAVPNVQFFMGDPNRDKKKNAPLRPPLPVTDAEMRKIFERIKEAKSAKPEIKTTIRPGDSIKVISGTFADNIGTVLEVKPDLNVVKTTLYIFGRETSIDLEFDQVEVIDKPTKQPEESAVDGEEEGFENAEKQKGGAKARSRGGPSAEIASAEDDLAALLEEIDEDESNENSEQSDDDGFGEAEIIDEDGSDEVSLFDNDAGRAAQKTNSKDAVASKRNGLISSNDELADLLSDDYEESSERNAGSGSTSEENDEFDELDDLDKFFSSLDDLDEGSDGDTGDNSVLDNTSNFVESVPQKGPKKRSVTPDELFQRLEAPFSKEDDEDDLGFSGEAILAEVDEMIAEVHAGKRKIGPQEEDHDLSKPIIETDRDLTEIDLFAAPDLEGHDDPDTTADPAPKKK